MKPFNLERALAGDPVVTRDGRSVKQITLFKDVEAPYALYCVVGQQLNCYTEGGNFYSDNDGTESSYDLFMESKRRMVWLNLYQHIHSASIHDSPEQADKMAGTNRIGDKAWPLEIEE